VEKKGETRNPGTAEELRQDKWPDMEQVRSEDDREDKGVDHHESSNEDKKFSQAKRRRLREVEKDRGRKMKGKRSYTDKPQKESGSNAEDIPSKRRKENSMVVNTKKRWGRMMSWTKLARKKAYLIRGTMKEENGTLRPSFANIFGGITGKDSMLADLSAKETSSSLRMCMAVVVRGTA